MLSETLRYRFIYGATSSWNSEIEGNRHVWNVVEVDGAHSTNNFPNQVGTNCHQKRFNTKQNTFDTDSLKALSHIDIEPRIEQY